MAARSSLYFQTRSHPRVPGVGLQHLVGDVTQPVTGTNTDGLSCRIREEENGSDWEAQG